MRPASAPFGQAMTSSRRRRRSGASRSAPTSESPTRRCASRKVRGRPALQCLEPERHFGEGYGEWVEIHAIYAAADHFCFRSSDRVGCDPGARSDRADAGKPAAEHAGRLNEEGAGAHGGITDADLEELLLGSVRVAVGGELNERIDEGVDRRAGQELCDLRGRVEGAGALAAAARGLEDERCPARDRG